MSGRTEDLTYILGCGHIFGWFTASIARYWRCGRFNGEKGSGNEKRNAYQKRGSFVVELLFEFFLNFFFGMFFF